ncbi:hypothetical protein [Paenibacillus periandrae]|nr:hypothetical protein [Paenibacillus periandrae]
MIVTVRGYLEDGRADLALQVEGRPAGNHEAMKTCENIRKRSRGSQSKLQ